MKGFTSRPCMIQCMGCCMVLHLCQLVAIWIHSGSHCLIAFALNASARFYVTDCDTWEVAITSSMSSHLSSIDDARIIFVLSTLHWHFQLSFYHAIMVHTFICLIMSITWAYIHTIPQMRWYRSSKFQWEHMLSVSIHICAVMTYSAIRAFTHIVIFGLLAVFATFVASGVIVVVVKPNMIVNFHQVVARMSWSFTGIAHNHGTEDITHTPITDMVMVVAVEPVFSYYSAMTAQELLSSYSSVKLVISIFSFPHHTLCMDKTTSCG